MQFCTHKKSASCKVRNNPNERKVDSSSNVFIFLSRFIVVERPISKGFRWTVKEKIRFKYFRTHSSKTFWIPNAHWSYICNKNCVDFPYWEQLWNNGVISIEKFLWCFTWQCYTISNNLVYPVYNLTLVFKTTRLFGLYTNPARNYHYRIVVFRTLYSIICCVFETNKWIFKRKSNLMYQIRILCKLILSL